MHQGVTTWSSTQPKLVADGSPVGMIVGSSGGLGLVSACRRWRELDGGSAARHITSAVTTAGSGAQAAAQPTSKAMTQALFSKRFVLFCSSSLLVHRPLEAYKPFCWPPYQRVSILRSYLLWTIRHFLISSHYLTEYLSSGAATNFSSINLPVGLNPGDWLKMRSTVNHQHQLKLW